MKTKHRTDVLVGRRGFTLIELLVVVAILSLLLALLTPALQKARKLAKESVCLSSMRRVMVGMLVYSSEYPVWPDPTDTTAYNLHNSSDERRAARWYLFFNEYTGGAPTPDLTYAAWKTLAQFGPDASPVWNGCPELIEAQSVERFHYGVFERGPDKDGDGQRDAYPTFGLRPSGVAGASSSGIIGESNAGVLVNGKIQGDTLFYMKDFGWNSRVGAVGYEQYQRHTKRGFNVGYLDGHVAFYPLSDPTESQFKVMTDLVRY